MTTIKNFIKENPIFVSFLVMLFILRTFFFTPFQVEGKSMDYTLADGDKLIGIKYFTPERSDIVILDSPTEEGKEYVKRVIGLPGDRIASKNDVIYINGEPLDEAVYLSEKSLANNVNTQDFEEITIPDGEYFVMGDNRNHSFDGTEFGPISGETIHAKIVCRFWPFNRLAWLN